MPTTSLPPDEICGYRIVRALAAETYLALEPHGRQVVLKKLDDDCLLQGQLHPSIKERLAKVRELPHLGTANLFGIERDAHGAFSIWEYLPGEDFASATQRCSPPQLIKLLRELVLTVESLHTQGIVHGALKCGNVIVDAHGRVKLTHVSPLLYNDPMEDAQAVMALARKAVAGQTEGSTVLLQILQSAEGSPYPLRALAGHLATLTHGASQPQAAQEPDDEGWLVRHHAIVSAVLIGLIGVAVVLGVIWWLSGV